MKTKLKRLNSVTGTVELCQIASYRRLSNEPSINDYVLVSLEGISGALVEMFEDDSIIRSHFILENEKWKRMIDARNLRGGL